MSPKYFDIHSHLNFYQYDNDRESVIVDLEENDIHTIIIGTDYESSEKAVILAEKYSGIYASIGVHPVDDPEKIFEEEKFEKLVRSPKVVAVGECGFDFFHASKTEDFKRQEELFSRQIDFAAKHDKPLMIHARDSYLDVINIFESFKPKYGKKLRGNIHFFSGDFEIAKKLFSLDFTISFTGVITFVRDYDEVIKQSPLEMIMSETDAPYVAPVPYRNRRNEPKYVKEVVHKIAEIRGEDKEFVRETLVNNALRMIR